MEIPNRVQQVQLVDDATATSERTRAVALCITFILKIIQTDSGVICSEIKESGIDLSQCIPAELLEALATFF